jgi:predicted HAD superfamily phosphohydrolase
MDILSELFSSQALVKIMRFFLLNSEEVFDLYDIAKKNKITGKKVRYETALLKRIGFLTVGVREVEIQFSASAKGGKNRKTPKKKKIKGLALNPNFALLAQLKSLILNAAPIARDQLLKKLKVLGSRLKLIILSGIFIDRPDSKIDIVVVGDSISRSRLESVLRAIETEIGKELNYASFSTEEFLYRLSMFDHFVHEIMESPHEKLLNKLNV